MSRLPYMWRRASIRKVFMQKYDKKICPPQNSWDWESKIPLKNHHNHPPRSKIYIVMRKNIRDRADLSKAGSVITMPIITAATAYGNLSA